MIASGFGKVGFLVLSGLQNDPDFVRERGIKTSPGIGVACLGLSETGKKRVESGFFSNYF
jgi:hypothetical protein